MYTWRTLLLTGLSSGLVVPSTFHLPLHFEPCSEANCSGAGRTMRFVSVGRDHRVFVGPEGAVLAQPEATVRMELLGADHASAGHGEEQLRGRTNYLQGNDPRYWRTNIPHYARVRYRSVYPGVDVIWHASGQELEFDFAVAPGADPARIRLRLEGGEVSLDKQGDLVIRTRSAETRLRKPVVYQMAGGRRREVPGRFLVRRSNLVTFALGAYDTGASLVIDPVVSQVTYLNHNNFPEVRSMAVDAAGNAYLAGITYPTRMRGSDVFVAKVDPSGSEVIYITYLGTENDDETSGIALDAAGYAYVTGVIIPLGLPMGFPRAGRPFVMKLTPDGSALGFSTVLSFFSYRHTIAVDTAGSVYLAGEKFAELGNPFPGNPLVSRVEGGWSNGFLAKLKPDASALVYGTYLGGRGNEHGLSVAVDAGGNAYVTGYTTSIGFPADRALPPDHEALFVTKINPTGSAFVYSTFLMVNSFYWRSSSENPSIAVDRAGHAYIAGGTASARLPVVNAMQPRLTGSAAFRSRDGGLTWEARGDGLLSNSVETLAIDPRNPSVLYAAGNEGVYKSIDGGDRWTLVLDVPSASGLIVDPANPDTVYVRVNLRVESGPDLLTPIYRTTVAGIYRTNDGGARWQRILGSAPFDIPFDIPIAIDPVRPWILYAVVRGNILWKTTDWGASWVQLTNCCANRYLYFLSVDPRNPDTVFAGGFGRLFRSTDGGSYWQEVARERVGTIAFDPVRPGTVYAAGVGILKSTDSGETWSRLPSPGAYVIGLTIDPSNPETMYGVVQDPEGQTAPWISADGGLRWQPAGKHWPPGVATLLLDPSNPRMVYAGTRRLQDAFAAKLNPSGSGLVYATYLGGAGSDRATGIAVDASGNAHVSGVTTSGDFPAAGGASGSPEMTSPAVSSLFLAKLDSSGSRFELPAKLSGGYGWNRVALDGSGAAYVLHNDDRGARLVRVGPALYAEPFLAPSGVVNLAASPGPTLPSPSLAPGTIVALHGAGLASATRAASAVPLPFGLLDTTVTFNGIPAGLLLVSPQVVHAQVPLELAAGVALVRLRTGGRITNTIGVTIVDSAPGIFTVVHSDFRPITRDDPARPGETVTIYCTGLGRFHTAVASGAAPPVPPPETLVRPEVLFDGSPGEVTYAGPAPGMPGVYQVNVRVPAGLGRSASVRMVVYGFASNVVTMALTPP